MKTWKGNSPAQAPSGSERVAFAGRPGEMLEDSFLRLETSQEDRGLLGRSGDGQRSGSRTRKTLAVLPFRNLSRDPRLDWLCFGLAEGLATAFALGSDFEIVVAGSLGRALLKPVPLENCPQRDMFIPSQTGSALLGSFGPLDTAGRFTIKVELRTDKALKMVCVFQANSSEHTSLLRILDRIVSKVTSRLAANRVPTGGVKSTSKTSVRPLDGETFSHYQIVKKIGSGGMGEVYLARDTSLRRQVAIKFMPHDLDGTREPFLLREARAAAAIDHPYICHVHEVGTTPDGLDFVVMEHVDSQSLRDRLESGPLSVGEALRIACEIGEALEFAHKRGIVHRDIKPENILFTEQGHAKVMDFGLALHLPIHALERDEMTTESQPEIQAGTWAYMAPEQLRGRAVDHRVDIFSFGVILYEMLTGIHPFRKDSPMGTVSAILTSEPSPMFRYSAVVPGQLERTVRKMLAKERAERFQSIEEVERNLKRARRRQLARGMKLSGGLWKAAAFLLFSTLARIFTRFA